MASGFTYRSGPWELDSMPTTASTAIAVGDSLKTTSGKVLVGVAATKVSGVALGTKAVGDSATTNITVIKALSGGRTKFLASPKNSSNMVVTDRHGQFDLYGTTGAQGFDRAVTTNGDVTIDKVLATGTTAGLALVFFSDPYSLSST